jgi:hypothetical protein
MTVRPFTGMFKRLAAARAGVAATEFALVLPFLLGAGLMGLEVANRVVVQMQVSQLAGQIADNASRIGDTSMLQNRKIYESDLNDLFQGAQLQGGDGLGLFEKGRVIISSLEVVPDTEDQQYIHWQRCLGLKNHTSTYGVEGDGLDGGLPGMGPAGEEVVAFPGEAVIFVEVAYDYDSIVGDNFGFSNQVSATASFTVRDDRDLTQIYQRDPGDPDPVASCSVYGATAGLGG